MEKKKNRNTKKHIKNEKHTELFSYTSFEQQGYMIPYVLRSGTSFFRRMKSEEGRFRYPFVKIQKRLRLTIILVIDT